MGSISVRLADLRPDRPRRVVVDGVPVTVVRVGDEVVVLGRSGQQYISTDEMADLMGTITYEVTCQINHRVKRYFYEGDNQIETT